MFCAANKADIPTAILKMIYEAAVIYEPFSISPLVSRAKDENVVKPPQMPTLRKSTSLGDAENCFNASAATRPIRKLPNTFTINVFIGNPSLLSIGSLPIKNQHTAPIAPPAATIRQSVIPTPTHQI